MKLPDDPLFTVIFGELPSTAPHAEAVVLPFESFFFEPQATRAGAAFSKRLCDDAFLDQVIGLSDVTSTPVPRTPSPTPAVTVLHEIFGEYERPVTSSTAPVTRQDDSLFTKQRKISTGKVTKMLSNFRSKLSDGYGQNYSSPKIEAAWERLHASIDKAVDA